MPAVCLTCGTMFPSGYFFEDSSGVMLGGNTASPCPKCGQVGQVPNGLYEFIENSVRLLSGPQKSVDDLRRLQRLIEEARQGGTDPSRVAAAVEEQLPDLGALIRRLLIPRNAGERYGFLSFLVGAIALALAMRDQPESVTNINIDRQVVQVVENCWQKDGSEKPASQFPTDAEQKSPQNHKPSKPGP